MKWWTEMRPWYPQWGIKCECQTHLILVNLAFVAMDRNYKTTSF